MTRTLFFPQLLDSETSLFRSIQQKEIQPFQRSRYTSFPFLTEIYSSISFVFFRSLALLFQTIGLKSFSKRAWVYSRHSSSFLHSLKTEKTFQNHFLAPSINTHQIGTENFYLSSPIPHSKPIGHPDPFHITLFHPKGICRGMSFWFLHLYFATKFRMRNRLEHLSAVGNSFAKGACPQAAVLHALINPPIYRLLRFKVQQDKHLFTPHQIENKLSSLSKGAYLVYTSDHALVYIKETPFFQFLFDPNEGTFHTPTPTLLKQVLHSSLSSHSPSKPLHIDKVRRV